MLGSLEVSAAKVWLKHIFKSQLMKVLLAAGPPRLPEVKPRCRVHSRSQQGFLTECIPMRPPTHYADPRSLVPALLHLCKGLRPPVISPSMQRRALTSALRLLAREAQAEGGAAARQYALRSVLVGAGIGSSRQQAACAASAFKAAPSGARFFSDMEPYSGIFYPEPEAEVGCQAPEFTAQGGFVAGGCWVVGPRAESWL